ncbi:ubiquitin-conjugating enzyme [Neocallimastix lanati (nom. inval.)]|uniref:E2 ubiquitin-conjugating enzyme n=1 Tax=Neocallimastix californiae TaxID=1754190 RepID=A0A1Y2DWZ5_9FUNG|nr:ubiquitin-conjugating enzyme [Neocallimastix sp. JGI-2020a]ORY63624.1 ubiquitin-conjugating enzyme [Neocallimastix californiae]|eukprot:ORY63624.1 ubiquitin-conjugating enzyme [Neocallimastix californiae]
MATNRIRKEYLQIQKNPVKLISIAPHEDNLYFWDGTLKGPVNSPYQGGTFKIKITFPQEYPFKPPVLKITTKIYHPNVDDDGSICMGILKPDSWKPTIKVTQVLEALINLIIEPNPADALRPHIGQEFSTNYDLFVENAKNYVNNYARK